MALDGDKVQVTFAVQSGLHLGTTTSAAAKVLSPVGTEYMELLPSGPGIALRLIPESRTSVPYNLVTDLSGLGTEIQQYNIPELEKSLEVSSQDLNATPAKETTAGLQRARPLLERARQRTVALSPPSSPRAPP